MSIIGSGLSSLIVFWALESIGDPRTKISQVDAGRPELFVNKGAKVVLINLPLSNALATYYLQTKFPKKRLSTFSLSML